MKVSVIVPIYNKEHFLKECLEHLVHQTLEDLEIILVEDCSRDASYDIANFYRDKYPNKIKLFRNDINRGVSFSRNFGIRQATGEYIGFVDSDDVVDYDFYQTLYQKAEKNNFPDMIRGQLVIPKKNGSDIVRHLEFLSNNSIIPNNQLPQYLLYETPSCCTKIYRRSLLSGEDFVNLRWEDCVFSSNKIIESNSIYYTEDTHYYYTTDINGRDSTSYQQPSSHILDFIDGYDIVESKAKELGKLSCFSDSLKTLQIKRLQNLMSHILNWDFEYSEMDIVEELLYYLCNYIELCYGNWESGGYPNFQFSPTCEAIHDLISYSDCKKVDNLSLLKIKMKQLLIPFD